MSLSVVICAYTMARWDSLATAVESCTKQSLAPDEIIVVIDYNEELRERATRELTSARVVANHATKGLSGARNTGVAWSSCDIVAFLDDDASAERDWLKHLMSPMADQKVIGVGGWVVPDWEDQPCSWMPETFYWVVGCSYEGLPSTGSPIRNPIGASMAIRRSVFSAVGGFSSGLGRVGQTPLGCEETELCIRYSASHPDEIFVLNRDAIVHHLVPSSRKTWHYFRSRCWAEGLSKAAVSSLVGTESGLASERRHLAQAIPREIARNLVSLPRHPRTSSARILAAITGSALALAGLLRGRYVLRRTPLENPQFDFELPSAATADDITTD